MLLLLLGCSPGADKEPAETGDSAESGDSADTGDTGDTAAPVTTTLRFTADGAGPVWVELTEASTGARRALTTEVDADLVVDLSPGAWTLRAWRDDDGDAAWTGAWSASPEPAALLGLRVPRDPLVVPLRAGLPEPFLDASPELVTLHDAAWSLLRANIHAGTPENGLADHYLDEGFDPQVFQWDTCFLTRFARYGGDTLPVMPSLDNFYDAQRADGYIGRVRSEVDGAAADPVDASELNLNPPLFAWAELAWARQTGDLSRVARVLPALDAYHDWIDANARTEPGLYYTSMLGSGMDNAPRETAYDAWVDMSAQQALGRRALAELAAAIGYGDGSFAVEQALAAESVCDAVATLTWDDTTGFFYDLDADGRPLTEKTLAGVWPLVAGCATPAQAARVAAWLADPSAFWRAHVFPSTAADAPSYEPDGHYWRGGVWAPTTFATVAALDTYGLHDLARAGAENHLDNLWAVYDRYVPDPDAIADGAPGGPATLWELYAPDDRAPGTRWDDAYLGRGDFVGWTGLGPIALLYEQVLGLSPDAPADTLVLRPTRADRHGVRGYRFGDQLVDLEVAARAGADAPVEISVVTSDAFVLRVEVAGATWEVAVPSGSSSWTFTPTSVVAPDLVPAGPFAGSAILGDGAVTAVVGHDATIGHLYPGTLGLDLVSSARLAVVDGLTEVPPTRVGLDPTFATFAEAPLADGGRVVWRTFVGEDAAVVLQGALVGGPSGSATRLVPRLVLREAPDLDGVVVPADNQPVTGGVAATWTDGRALVVAGAPAPWAVQAGTFDHLDPDGTVGPGRDLALSLPVEAAAGEEVPFRWVLAPGADLPTAEALAAAALGRADALADARDRWAELDPDCGPSDRCRVATANLYAAAASAVGGDVPADLTGQFTTNGFPQLYPRDAMMVARTLATLGHPDRAWAIVAPWFGRPGPAPGEWYARYDALGRPVDGGTGADFDVPEWDANAWLALLVEQVGPERLSTAEREIVLTALDFLVTHQDPDGLWEEGGIVEWPGRLPSTTMAAAAGLEAGARLAEEWGEPARAEDYRAAAGLARAGLWRLWDNDRATLADQRDGALGYDTSLFFGTVVGFPAGPLTDASYRFAREEASALGGGVRYFEAEGYGQDLFFFTTAGVADYADQIGDDDGRAELDAWMLGFTNRFGLAPERVYASGDGAAPASPLSWCAAELARVLLSTPTPPALDGVVFPAEYRPWATSLVDDDGLPDRAGDPLALYVRQDGDALVVGLVVAGAPGEARLYLSEANGQGPIAATPDGQPLRFRADPEATPGARVEVTLTADGCDVGACVVGERGWEVALDLGGLGLTGPVQIVAAAIGDGAGDRGGDDLLPESGALWSAGVDTQALVTFRVDARAVPLGEGEGITLSGDRAELGAWAGDALPLYDDGTHGDTLAGDGWWATTVRTPRGGAVSWKFLRGVAGDGSWAGVEFDGADRSVAVDDPDGAGRVVIEATFGTRGEAVVDR